MTIELNKIYNQDCLEGMKDIYNKSIDMILCDLPYGTTQNKWDIVISFDLLWIQYKRIVKDNAAIVLFGSQPFTTDLINSNREWFRCDIIYEKSHDTGFLNANKMPLRGHEEICVFYKKLPIYNSQFKKKDIKNVRKVSNKGRLSTNYGKFKKGNYRKISIYEKYPNSIIKFNFPRTGNRLHPTEKPVELFSYLIKTYTNENDIVLDNCIGSGTTAIACHNLNRKFIGFEKDKNYFDIAQNRFKKHISQLRMF